LSELHEELLGLIADVRAVAQSSAHRGAKDELDPTAVRLPPAAPAPAVPSAWATVVEEARRTSTGSEGLQAIREDLGDCQRCGLCSTRKNIVFGVGTAEADLVIVGEGPGHEEDLSGEPFVGPAGQMLDRMLDKVLDLQRSQVYILNVVKCRPPGNRNPAPEEMVACMPFMERQLRAIQPKLVLVLGSVALKALLNTTAGIMKSRGVWHEWSGIPVMPTFHPAYLLRNPDDKRKTMDDLLQLKSKYDQLGGRRFR